MNIIHLLCFLLFWEIGFHTPILASSYRRLHKILFFNINVKCLTRDLHFYTLLSHLKKDVPLGFFVIFPAIKASRRNICNSREPTLIIKMYDVFYFISIVIRDVFYPVFALNRFVFA